MSDAQLREGCAHHDYGICDCSATGCLGDWADDASCRWGGPEGPACWNIGACGCRAMP